MSEPHSDKDKLPPPEATVVTGGLKILVPDTRSLAESNQSTPKVEGKVEDDCVAAEYAEGQIFAGMKLESVSKPAMRSPMPNAVEAEVFDIDVVQVLGALPSQHRLLSLQNIEPMIGNGSEKREFLFYANTENLLNEDIEFTRRNVDAEAHRLVSALKHFQHSDAELSRRSIIFIAYDIGAIVLQRAISIASTQHVGEPGLFSDTLQIVSCGCFQRAENDKKMGVRMFKFLESNKDLKLEYVTLPAAQNLAWVSREARTSFLQSKIVLRSRLISLYSGSSGGQIHEIFDYFTATLGIVTELTVQEMDTEDLASTLLGLAGNLIPTIRGLAHDQWQVALESTLMSMTPPPAQIPFVSHSKDHPILSSDVYHTWLSESGTQILLIDGPDSRANLEASEQVRLDWVARKTSSARKVFSFKFDGPNSRDPIASFVPAVLLHFLSQCGYSGLRRRPFNSFLEDQLKLQNAWLDKDIVNLTCILEVMVPENNPTFLLGLDECNADDREALWTMIGQAGSNSEEPAKFVVTTNKPGSVAWLHVVQKELIGWPGIKLLGYTTILENLNPANHCENDFDGYHSAWLARLCPKGLGQPELCETLQRLSSMDRKILDEILKLLETYSQWPTTLSSANFVLFCSLLQKVASDSTTQSVLDNILQALPNQVWLQWLLRWTWFAQRPLTSLELSTLLCYCNQKPAGRMGLLDEQAIQHSLHEIHNQLRGLLEFSEQSVCISGIMLQAFERSQKDFWKVVRDGAPYKTADFLLGFLGSPEIQDRLEDLYEQYKGRIQRSQRGLTPPLVPDRRDAIFYAVQALPYHLSCITVPIETQKLMRDPKGPYTAWAKVYWAMSNPFSRTAKGPLQTAWSTWETSPESGPFNLVRTHFLNEESDMGEREERLPEQLMESLLAAVKEGNEDCSMTFAEQVLVEFRADRQNVSKIRDKDNPHRIAWPTSILWRATLLGMNRLLEFLLDNGMQVDDNSCSYTPSPLYLATHLGNPETLKLLIQRGADVRITTPTGRRPFVGALIRGNPDVVKLFLEKDGSMLEERHPCTPLYTAACFGCWKVVELLLQHGAQTEGRHEPSDPSKVNYDPERFWTPLTVAVSRGFSKTTRLLLEHGADPDKGAPWEPQGNRLPLYYAAVERGSVELVRLLLENKADPNHSRLEPPILTAIITQGAKLTNETKMEMFNVFLRGYNPVPVDKSDANGQTALMAAAKKGDMTAIRLLLENGANVDALDSKNQHALFWAVLERQHLAVKALLSRSVKPRLDLKNTWGETLVQATLGDIGLLKMLVDAGVDLTYANDREQTVLNVAVTKGDREAVKYLLSLEPDKNLDIHHSDDQGYTPILDATGYKPDTEVARMLMDRGARLSDVTEDGASPLHLAAREARLDLLRVLLEYHCQEDLERRDNYGDTPLLDIGEWSDGANLDCILLLIRAGSDFNAKNKEGWTLLMKVAKFGPKGGDIHDHLLSRPGMDIKSVNEYGLTPLHLASCFGAAALVTKLLERGADPNARAFCVLTTPLIAACIQPNDGGSDIEGMAVVREGIVRDLVQHSAAVDTIVGVSLFSPLAAASMYANVATINYLLDKAASARRPDPLGRLPIHFAAANGIRNFEALALVHDDDIMVSDRFSKNVLHWAAEFGHVKALRAILERLSLKERRHYVNAGDADGWTPLAWACRPTTVDVGGYKALSERPDYPATIQCLLDHGADKSIRFQIGKDEEFEEDLTPLKMARQCGHNDDILGLLEVDGTKSTDAREYPHDDADNLNDLLVEGRKYRKTMVNCDFCFSQIWGLVWVCKSCFLDDYALCNKCYRRGRIEHPRAVSDHREGQEHDFEISNYGREVFESIPWEVSSVKTPSVNGSDTSTENEQEDTDGETNEANEELTPGLDDLGYEVDDIGELELPDLEQLGQLDT